MRSFTSSPLLLFLLPSIAHSYAVLPELRPTTTASAPAIAQITPASTLPRIADQLPVQTALVASHENLDLRQVIEAPAADPAAVDPLNPANPVVAPVDPAIAPLDPAVPALSTSSLLSSSSAAVPLAPGVPAVVTSISTSTLSTSTTSLAPVVPVPPANPVKPINNPVQNPNPAPLPTNAPPVGSIWVTVQWLETHITMPSTTSTTWVPVTITMKFEAVPQQGAQPGNGRIGLGTITGAENLGVTKTVAEGAAATMGPMGGKMGVMGMVGGVFGLGMLGMAG